jgi:tetratricopeptide (TPR) repeat protein
MKGNKREPKAAPKSVRARRGGPGGSGRTVPAAVADRPNRPERPKRWLWLLAFLIAAAAVFEVYGPALNGPFLLDDSYLPYMRPGWDDMPLWMWLRGVRPLLMLSFWLNFQWSQHNPFSYHVVNVVMHILNGCLVFAIASRILSKLDMDLWRRRTLAAFGGALFLFHPLQTESVAYVASRSETLSVFFVYVALGVFLWRRREAVSWGRSLAVLAIFAAACLTKEHTLVLPALLLLTDYYWNPGFSVRGIVRNWRLYIPLAALGVAGALSVVPLLVLSTSAGFHVKGLTWTQYFFTQCRAIWVYLGKFVLPIHQNIDYEFAISRTLTDHGAIFGLLALAMVTAAAWLYRRRVPLASYGWFAFLILIAPTSSFVPIQDPLVERRLYLPFIGLVFVVLELLRRWRATRRVLAVTLALIIVAEAWAAWQRNQLWGDRIAMWQDSARQSPGKVRPQFQLAHAYYKLGQFGESVEGYEKAARIEPPKYDLLVDWGIALAYAGRTDEALAKLQRAATLERSAYVYTQIAMVDGRAGRYAEALAALDTAETIDSRFELIFEYRGTVYFKQRDPLRAAAEFRRGLAIEPSNDRLRGMLVQAEQAAGKP